jgi:thiol-disulfide isomerase/thioredoxin
MHRRTLRATLLVAALALLITPLAALAEPPTDEQIETIVSDAYAWYRENYKKDLPEEQLAAKAEEMLAEVSIDECTAQQINELSMLLSFSPKLQDRAMKRLATLTADESAEGASAALIQLTMSFSSGEPDDQLAAARTLVTHPGLHEALETGKAGRTFSYLDGLSDEHKRALAGEIIALRTMIDENTDPSTLAAATDYLSTLRSLGDEASPAMCEKVRLRLKELCAKAADDQREENERFANYLDGIVEYLDGAYARGELIDHAAPALAFTWSDGHSTSITSLDDLKGNVIVLDFWATWCGPCIRSFPDIRKLQKHYDGYNVVVLGVTSLQGRHYPGDGEGPVDCTDDPQKEYELMGEFMDAKDITWAVAFSEQEVFNPDFGVRGIPHMAIVDPAGKVRYNGMHPSGSTLAEKAAKIDKLLKEAGKPTPEPPAAEDTDDA